MTSVAPTPAIDNTGYFANLVMEWGQLLIPQTDIDSLEPVLDMQPAIQQAEYCIGQLEKFHRISPVYCLSSQLTWLTNPPASYRIIVLLKNNDQRYGILCEQISILAANQLKLHPVPVCMISSASPLQGLAVYNEEVRYVTSAHALQQHLMMDTGLQ